MSDVVVLLVAMEDISCRVIYSLSVHSSSVVILNSSVIFFVCEVLSLTQLVVGIALY